MHQPKKTIVTDFISGKKMEEKKQMDLMDMYFRVQSMYACTLFGCQEIVATNKIGENIKLQTKTSLPQEKLI